MSQGIGSGLCNVGRMEWTRGTASNDVSGGRISTELYTPAYSRNGPVSDVGSHVYYGITSGWRRRVTLHDTQIITDMRAKATTLNADVTPPFQFSVLSNSAQIFIVSSGPQCLYVLGFAREPGSRKSTVLQEENSTY